MTDPLPRRIAWFAPWTWKRRWWILAAVLVFVVYPLSVGPTYYLVNEKWIPPWCFLPYLPLINTAMQYDATKEILFAYLRWFYPYPYIPFD